MAHKLRDYTHFIRRQLLKPYINYYFSTSFRQIMYYCKFRRTCDYILPFNILKFNFLMSKEDEQINLLEVSLKELLTQSTFMGNLLFKSFEHNLKILKQLIKQKIK